MARPRRQERGVFANLTPRELADWFDNQEQKPFLRVAPRNRILEAFDPLHRRRGDHGFQIPDRIVEIYDAGERGEQGRLGRRHRIIKWRFLSGLKKPLVPQIMNKIKQHVRTRHKLNIAYAYNLRNIENNELLLWYTNYNSPWFATLSETTRWLREQEELRLQNEHIDRPNTKWVFESAAFVEIKAILDRQPLQIGLGDLPPWLRNKREVISLDTFNDDCCFFRCLAVHQGARRDL